MAAKYTLAVFLALFVFASVAETRPIAELQITVGRTEILNSEWNWLNTNWLIPHIVPRTGGKIDGFTFMSFPKGSVFPKIGLLLLDVIRSVDGRPIESPSGALGFCQDLKTHDHSKILVEREKRLVLLNITVKNN